MNSYKNVDLNLSDSLYRDNTPGVSRNVQKSLLAIDPFNFKLFNYDVLLNLRNRETILSGEREKLLNNIKQHEKFNDQFSKESLQVLALERAGFDKEASLYKDCGKFFRKLRCLNCNAEFHKRAYSCNLRFCDYCCKKNYQRIFERVMPVVKKYSNTKGFRVVEMTLTWREGVNESDNKELEKRNKEVNKLLYWLKRKGMLKGSIKSYELKRSKQDFTRLHIHVHILAVMGFVLQKTLSDKWLEITKTSNVVDIRSRSPEGALRYTLKNLYKPPEILPSDLPTFIKLYYGRRRLITMGCFYRCGFTRCREISSELLCEICGYELEEIGVFSVDQLTSELVKGVG